MIDRTAELIRTLEPSVAHAALLLVNAARSAGIPLILISARRSVAENEAIGGAPASLHLDGLAFDVAVAGYTREQVPAWWWQALGRWVEQYLGLSWGGRFSWKGAPDVNHFDARNRVL
jgi:hypothetical protein